MANFFPSTYPPMPNLSNLSSSPSPDTLQISDSSHLLLAVAMTLTMLVAFVGNTLVIFVIWNTRKLHTITCGFLLNLAISDLCAGVLLIPFAIGGIILDGFAFNHTILCQCLGFLYEVLCFVSTWTLVAISIERYIAINNPLQYHSIVTKNRAWVVIVLTWLLAIAVATIPFYHRPAYIYLEQYGFCLLNYADYQITAIFLPSIEICIPFLVLCYTYSSIGHVACTQARKKVIECNEEHCVFVSPKKKDYRAAKILAMMAGVFIFCWFPFTLLSLTQAIKPPGSYPVYVTLLSLWLTLLSSAINPWLYSILNRTFRIAMHKSALHFMEKVTHGRLGNNNEFGFTDGETTRPKNSLSQDNVIDRKSDERTPTKLAQIAHKTETLKLEPVKEINESYIEESPKVQIPGQIECPDH